MDPPLLLQLFIFGFFGFYIKDRSQINHSLGSEVKERACLRSGKTDFLYKIDLYWNYYSGKDCLCHYLLAGPWRYKALKTVNSLVYQEDNSVSASATHCFWCLAQERTLQIYFALLYIE